MRALVSLHAAQLLHFHVRDFLSWLHLDELCTSALVLVTALAKFASTPVFWVRAYAYATIDGAHIAIIWLGSALLAFALLLALRRWASEPIARAHAWLCHNMYALLAFAPVVIGAFCYTWNISVFDIATPGVYAIMNSMR